MSIVSSEPPPAREHTPPQSATLDPGGPEARAASKPGAQDASMQKNRGSKGTAAKREPGRYPPELGEPDAAGLAQGPPERPGLQGAPSPGLGPLRLHGADAHKEPGLAPAACTPTASLETQGVELFRLGRDRRGHAELHLRLRCEEGVLEARLTEDGAQGVRMSLAGTLGEARLGRLARTLEEQGHEARLDREGGCPQDPGSRGDRGRDQTGCEPGTCTEHEHRSLPSIEGPRPVRLRAGSGLASPAARSEAPLAPSMASPQATKRAKGFTYVS